MLFPKKRALAQLTAALAAAIALGSCCAKNLPRHCCTDKKYNSRESFQAFFDPKKPKFDLAWTPAKGEKPVYLCNVPADDPARRETAAQRPVLLLHEYDRLSGATLDLAERLSKQGFKVYVPLLYGRAEGGRGGWPFIRNTLELIFSPEWNVAAGVNEHQPITEWLERVCWRISKASPREQRGVAVIGMCLTGAFPIALMDQKCVIGAVLAQPSAPIFCLFPGAKEAPGVSQKELQDAGERAHHDDIDVFWTRYKNDTISPEVKWGPIHAAFGTHLKDHTIRLEPAEQEKWDIPKHAHATLTHCFHEKTSPGYPPRILFENLLTYLNAQFHQHGDLSASTGRTIQPAVNTD